MGLEPSKKTGTRTIDWDSLVIRGSESCGSGNNCPVRVQSERRTYGRKEPARRKYAHTLTSWKAKL